MADQQGYLGGPQGSSQSQGPSIESLDSQREALPTPRLVRVKKDIVEFFADPPPGIFISPEETDITNIHALVIGPLGTPYEGGFFRFLVSCPSTYPMAPPQVRFLTTDAGRLRFNPNLYSCGKVCLSILGTWEGPPWNPALSLSSLLISLQSLLNENPFYNEPAFAEGSHEVESKRYNARILHETMRVAVCDAVEDCLKDDSPYPPAFKDAVLKKFAASYQSYEDVLKSHVHLSGSPMAYGILPCAVGRFEYHVLLMRLKDLKARVDKLNEAALLGAST